MPLDKVSVIIVTYNAEPDIKKAIESVLTQQYENLELIIIDGGSTDKTVEIIKSYQNQIHFWKSESDNGIYDAMNKGIAASTGNWLLFLGADDRLCSGVIPEIFGSGQNHSSGIIYGKVLVNDTNKSLGEKSDYIKLISNNIPHQGIFYNRSVFEKYPGYDFRYKILADYDLNLKIFKDQSIIKEFIDTPISIFNTRGVSNRTIDYLFFTEKKNTFIQSDGISKNDKMLAKYYFFSGVAMVLKKNYVTGFKNIFHPVIHSNNRLYYFLLAVNFILTFTGLGKKYKYV